jgi:hypothetical protein
MSHVSDKKVLGNGNSENVEATAAVAHQLLLLLLLSSSSSLS